MLRKCKINFHGSRVGGNERLGDNASDQKNKQKKTKKNSNTVCYDCIFNCQTRTCIFFLLSEGRHWHLCMAAINSIDPHNLSACTENLSQFKSRVINSATFSVETKNLIHPLSLPPLPPKKINPKSIHHRLQNINFLHLSVVARVTCSRIKIINYLMSTYQFSFVFL